MEKSKSRHRCTAQKIEDYAVIGDCETAALVGRNGSIDWLCWPKFASGACFAALLGTAEHGYWQIAPEGEVKSSNRRYLPDSVVVETTFETADGAVMPDLDFMPPRGESSNVVRLVRGVRGKVKMQMQLAIRFDYGRTIPWVTHDGFWGACDFGAGHGGAAHGGKAEGRRELDGC